MTHLITSFLLDESGAITVDWVVLTAAVVGLAAGGAAATLNGVSSLSGDVSSTLSDKQVN